MAKAIPLSKGEQLFRIGLQPNCPVHRIYAGGQCFTRFSEKVSGYGSETKRTEVEGSIVRMQSGQEEKVLEAIKHKVIRATRGRKSRARVYDNRSRNYRDRDEDVPVGKFMFMEALTKLANPFDEEATRPSLAEPAPAPEPTPKKAKPSKTKAKAEEIF